MKNLELNDLDLGTRASQDKGDGTLSEQKKDVVGGNNPQHAYNMMRMLNG